MDSATIIKFVGRPAPVKLTEVLLHLEERFSLYKGSPDDIQGRIPLGRYYGSRSGYLVWLGEQQDCGNEQTIHGLFEIDRTNKRILYFPNRTIPERDSYRAWGSVVYYDQGLIEVLRLLEAKGLKFFQAAKLNSAHEALGFGAVYEHVMDITRLMSRALHEFNQRTGLSGVMEAFQIDGEIGLDQILTRQRLPIVPATLDAAAYLQRLKTDWGFTANSAK